MLSFYESGHSWLPRSSIGTFLMLFFLSHCLSNSLWSPAGSIFSLLKNLTTSHSCYPNSGHRHLLDCYRSPLVVFFLLFYFIILACSLGSPVPMAAGVNFLKRTSWYCFPAPSLRLLSEGKVSASTSRAVLGLACFSSPTGLWQQQHPLGWNEPHFLEEAGSEDSVGLPYC